MSGTLGEKTASATRWSVFAEIAAKLVSPIVSMVLARLLTPEAFGAVATITVVVSFADLFSDAGFQKYLVQCEVSDDSELDLRTDVAFWANLFLSLLVWGLIVFFRDSLAAAVGSPDLGMALTVAAASLPLTSFSSVQMARLRREFAFRKLFFARIAGSCMPLLVTVPLAVLLRSYWALIAGTIATNLCNAVVLSAMSRWHPSLRFNFSTLRQMLSFSWWVLLESVAVWASSSLDTFLVGRALDAGHLGLYKTGTSTVSAVMSLVSSSTSAPLFSALSRLQGNVGELVDTFLRYTRAVAVFIIPLGVGIWLYADVVTGVLLGDQWVDATGLVGMWGFSGAVCLVLGTYCNGLYDAVGKTKLSFAVQVSSIFVMVPVVLVTAGMGYEELCIGRTIVRFELVLAQVIVMGVVFGVSPRRFLGNVVKPALCSVVMAVATLALRGVLPGGMVWGLVCIPASITVYFLTMRFVARGLVGDSLAILGFRAKGGAKSD